MTGPLQILRRIAPNLFDPPLNTRPIRDLNASVAGSMAALPIVIAYGLVVASALGPVHGSVGVLVVLYGSVIVGLAAAVLGGNPLSIPGPRASTMVVFATLIAQLVHSTALAHLSNPGPVALALASMAVMICGVLQILFGAFRLGRLARYVPLPVVAGFVNATALIIVLGQVWLATGITAQRSIFDLFDHLHEIRPATLLLALATTVAVLLLPRLTRRLPPLLLAVVAGTAIYHLLAAFGFGPALGGTLSPPAGFTLAFVGNETAALLGGPHGSGLLRTVLLAALSMAILTTLDSLIALSAADALTGRNSDGDRQLMAEGLGNAVGGSFGMAPAAGSLVPTHTAVRSGMASAATPLGVALIALAVAVFMAPLIGLLSRAVMAGMLIAIGIGLIDKWTLARLRGLLSSRDGLAAPGSDLAIVGVVVATALLADLPTAVGIGILLSLLLFAVQMARGPIRRSYHATAIIPQIFNDLRRRDFIERHGKKIAVLELEGALFFGTARELEARVEALASAGARHVVLDMRRVKHIDATGARTLEHVNNKLAQLGGLLVVSHVDRERRYKQDKFPGTDNRAQSWPRNNWTRLADLGTVATLGAENFVSDTDAAVARCEKHLAGRSTDATDTAALPGVDTLLLESLGRPLLRRLRRYWSRAAFRSGDVVFSQRDASDGVFFVAAGRCDVLIDIPGTERKRKIQSLAAGSVFGEMALIDPQPRSASIVATEVTTCYWIPSARFGQLKAEQPDIAFELIAAIAMIFADRLRATNTMLAEMEA